jgi:hypothetical protein
MVSTVTYPLGPTHQGWLGDAQLAFDTVQHNFDGGAFYSKWVRDLADVQQVSGFQVKPVWTVF